MRLSRSRYSQFGGCASPSRPQAAIPLLYARISTLEGYDEAQLPSRPIGAVLNRLEYRLKK